MRIRPITTRLFNVSGWRQSGASTLNAPYTVRPEEVFPGKRLGRPLSQGCVAWLTFQRYITY